jgi:hypothetical protein
MATLADVLRNYTPPTESPMTQVVKDYAASIPQKFNENQAEQMNMLKRAFPDGTLKNADPRAMAEFGMQVPLGGITNIFHGTSPEAAANIAKRGFNVKKSADGTIWFTENPEIGEVAATGKGAVVKRILNEDKLKLATPEQADKYFIDQLISEGYEGVKYPSYGKGDFTHYQIFNPQKLTKEKASRKEILEKELKKVVE